MLKCAKLSTGLTEPIAGPIFPNDDAAAPMAEIKSSPIKVNNKLLIINISIYNIKKIVCCK